MWKKLQMAGLLLTLAVPSASAFARPVFVEPEVGVGVRLAFDPYVPHAVAPYRTGYVWVGGHYARGMWVPGFYRPTEVRPGWAFEPGYWRDGLYYDGFWREAAMPGQYWVPGHYGPRGWWIPGHWNQT